MGVLDRIFGKKDKTHGPSIKSNKDDELRKIIEQVRGIPGVDTVFEMLDLINHENGSLIQGAIIQERTEEEKEGEKIISIANVGNESLTRRLRLTIANGQIVVKGGIDNKETGDVSILEKRFDKKSKVEIHSTRQKGNKATNIVSSRIEATRAANDVEKVICSVWNGRQTVEHVVDASYADADISTLDAVDEIDFEALNPNQQEIYNWSMVRRKIEKSANRQGLCEFIQKNNLGRDEKVSPEYILDLEGARRTRDDITRQLFGDDPIAHAVLGSKPVAKVEVRDDEGAVR